MKFEPAQLAAVCAALFAVTAASAQTTQINEVDRGVTNVNGYDTPGSSRTEQRGANVVQRSSDGRNGNSSFPTGVLPKQSRSTNQLEREQTLNSLGYGASQQSGRTLQKGADVLQRADGMRSGGNNVSSSSNVSQSNVTNCVNGQCTTQNTSRGSSPGGVGQAAPVTGAGPNSVTVDISTPRSRAMDGNAAAEQYEDALRQALQGLDGVPNPTAPK